MPLSTGEQHAKSKRPKLEVVGRTIDGRPVVDFFRLVDTHGIPLDIVVSTLLDSEIQPDWIGFYETAIERGWKQKGVLLKLEGVVGDVLGPKELELWKLYMEKYLEA